MFLTYLLNKTEFKLTDRENEGYYVYQKKTHFLLIEQPFRQSYTSILLFCLQNESQIKFKKKSF